MPFLPKIAPVESIFSTISKLSIANKAINLGQGYPDFDCDPVLQQHICQALHEGYNQYAPMAGSPDLRNTLAAKIKHCYELSINPDTQLCITAGATQALFTAIMAFVRKEDEVIIIEPAYDCYKPAIELAGGQIVPIPIRYPDYQVDWTRVREAITSSTKMIIINTPHNPTGSILSDEDLTTLETIVTGRDIIVLSDEVYEHLIYDGEQHQSVLRFPTLFQQSLAVYSFGKTLHATGWKLGYVVGPENLISEFKNIHQWNIFSANSFVQQGIARYLLEPKHYENLGAFFQKKRDFLSSAMKGSALQPLPTKGTYFQLYDYSELSDLDDLSFAKYLTSEIGVAAIPLSPFYAHGSEDKVVRLCFAKKEETLQSAVEKFRLLR